MSEEVYPDHGTLNWLRAGLLGANDGIVSVAAVAIGVAGATTSTKPILLAGAAALIGGAVSMALGEYVSVSSQRDSLRAARGGAHNTDDVSPWHAALASAVAFLVGGVLPLIAIVLLPEALKVPLTTAVVVLALAIAGFVSARLGRASVLRATLRVVIGGLLALGVTYALGTLLRVNGLV